MDVNRWIYRLLVQRLYLWLILLWMKVCSYWIKICFCYNYGHVSINVKLFMPCRHINNGQVVIRGTKMRENYSRSIHGYYSYWIYVMWHACSNAIFFRYVSELRVFLSYYWSSCNANLWFFFGKWRPKPIANLLWHQSQVV